jgi:ligand-binding sensor domain-containing protein
MRFFTYILLVVGCSLLFAQTKGDYFMSHYAPESDNVDFSIFDVTTDLNGLLWVSSNYGLYTYDGREWDFYETPTAAVSLVVSTENIIYVGGVGEVGKIDFSNKQFGYQVVFENDSLSDIYLQAVSDEKGVYFAGSKSVIKISEEGVEERMGDFVSLYQTYKKPYINTSDTTFLLEPFMRPAPEHGRISFSFRKDQKEAVFTFDGDLKINGVKVLHNDLIRRLDFYPSSGVFVNDTLFVLSSLDKGALFLNTRDTSYHKTIDYYSGLPDNEIYAMHVDDESGVWLAHEFGLSRVMPLFPATTYSNLPGLRGNLLSVKSIENRLWVTTSLGVYYYNQDTTYKTKVFYEKKREVQQVKRPAPKPEETSSEKNDNGFLGGLFNKQKRAEEDRKGKPVKGFFKDLSKDLEDIFAADGEIDKIVGKKNSKVEYVRKEEKIPVKISNEFSHIPGANGKFFDVFKYKGRMIAVANSGIYEITKEKSSQVVDEAIRDVEVTRSGQILLYTYTEELALYELDGDVWYELWRQSLNDALLNIYCNEKNELWLLGSEKLYQTAFTDSLMMIVDMFDVSNQHLDQFSMIETEGDSLWYVSKEGFFYFQEDSGNFVEDEKRSKIVNPVQTTMKDAQGHIWIFDGDKWYEFDSRGKIGEFEYLSLFPDIRYLTRKGEGQRYWIITDDNLLFSYDIDEAVNLDTQNKLFVKKVQSRINDYESARQFTLSYDENYLSVNISNPDFTGLLKPQYQYRLSGLNKEWSEWTNNNIIDFSYLPPGAYSLEVRTRDNFGRSSDYQLLSFNVETPYWQRPWFYALQVIFFMSLIFMSSRLNQSNSSNRLLSGGLTIITIVLFIEFLQSVIGSYINIKSSPVIDFAVDAAIALMIFPLERFLRAFIKAGGNIFKLKKVMLDEG